MLRPAVPPLALVLSLGWLLALPSSAAAQADEMASETEQRAMYELPTLSITIRDATPLDERAAELFQQGRWSEAADLYRESAETTPDNDVAAYTAHDMAARLYFYGRDYESARKSMERAAEVAEATGDIVSAAYRHVDAAFMAVWEGYPASRREHISRAEELAADAEFGDEHARQLEALIHGVTALPIQGDTE